MEGRPCRPPLTLCSFPPFKFCSQISSAPLFLARQAPPPSFDVRCSFTHSLIPIPAFRSSSQSSLPMLEITDCQIPDSPPPPTQILRSLRSLRMTRGPASFLRHLNAQRCKLSSSHSPINPSPIRSSSPSLEGRPPAGGSRPLYRASTAMTEHGPPSSSQTSSRTLSRTPPDIYASCVVPRTARDCPEQRRGDVECSMLGVSPDFSPAFVAKPRVGRGILNARLATEDPAGVSSVRQLADRGGRRSVTKSRV